MCAILLGAAGALLAALPSQPTAAVAGGVYAITQGSGAASLNDSLARNLTAQPWAQAVSPEVLVFTTALGRPVLVRGGNLTDVLAVEGASLVQSGPATPLSAYVGSDLAARAGLVLGQSLTLQGSSSPRLEVVLVSGVYRSGSSGDDEIVVGLDAARFLTGTAPGTYYAIRVRTQDPAALVAFLDAFRASVHVVGPGGLVGGANTAPATDARALNLLLRSGVGSLPADYLAEALTEATNSVRVAVLGLAALVAVLVATGVHAVQARAFADRRAAIGVLRGLGASGGWIGRRLLAESLPASSAAAVLGLAVGWVFAASLAPAAGLLVFGHAVSVGLDPVAFAILAAVLVTVSAASQLLLLRGALADRPEEAVRGEPDLEPPSSLEVVLRG